MEKKNGEKLAASWWLQPDWGKDISFSIRSQHGIPSPKMNMSHKRGNISKGKDLSYNDDF